MINTEGYDYIYDIHYIHNMTAGQTGAGQTGFGAFDWD